MDDQSITMLQDTEIKTDLQPTEDQHETKHHRII